MNKTLKITIGILISALLFYLFIKDVNQLKLAADSGYHHGVHSLENRVIYLNDVTGLHEGDTFTLFDDDHPEGVHCVLEEIKASGGEKPLFTLVTEQPISVEFKVENNAAITYPRLEKALKSTNYWWLIPTFLLTMLALWVRAYRWKFFFPDHHKLRTNSLWVAVCIGYMANNLLPFRMGEFIRAWILSNKESRSLTESFATIIMERVFDIISILIIFVLFIFHFSSRDDVTLPEWLMEGALILAVISAAALGFLLALRFKTDFILRWMEKLMKPFPARISQGIMNLMGSFIEGLSVFRNITTAAIAFGLSMVIWVILAFGYYTLFLAIHIQASLLTSVFLIVGLAFAVSIPSAPGYIGTYHFVGKEVLKIVGLHGNIEAYVLLAHAMAYIPVIIVGLIYLSLENLSFRDLKKSIQPFLKSAEKRGVEVGG